MKEKLSYFDCYNQYLRCAVQKSAQFLSIGYCSTAAMQLEEINPDTFDLDAVRLTHPTELIELFKWFIFEHLLPQYNYLREQPYGTDELMNYVNRMRHILRSYNISEVNQLL